MTRVITIVPCVSKKRDTPQRARDLYCSDLFKKAAAYAEKTSDEWYILSAKYGLVHPLDVIAPYNVTLKKMKVKPRKEWAERVFSDLGPLLQPTDTVVFLAGIDYREYLVPRVRQLGCRVEIPMEGLRIGEQLRWLKNQLEDL